MSVVTKEYLPAAALQPYVQQYWEGTFYGSASATLHQKIIPSGFIEFILHFSDARCEMNLSGQWDKTPAFILVGLWTTPFQVQFREKVTTFSIRFFPEAMYFLFGIPAYEFLNRPNDLLDILGAPFSSFCHQLEGTKDIRERIALTDRYLLRVLNKSQREIPYLSKASNLIRTQNGQLTVENLSSEACISPRQLEREFKNKLGISPKTYLRLSRLHFVQNLLQEHPHLNFAQLSYLSGYSDQAHFIKDFKQLTGDIPSEYVTQTVSFVDSD